ncbi:hypothetical protein Tco_0976058 [Tanacetum coccineum]|uniref:Reverse transcriptase domain-containing protein n=1 Tax=Tanacetum coccineum TaxID=301880 RepID=A0ABQ5EGB6_9ASTR
MSTDCYPLPEIRLEVESLCGYPSKCFLDAYKGITTIKWPRIDEGKNNDRPSQQVRCLIDYTKMPFGLKIEKQKEVSRSSTAIESLPRSRTPTRGRVDYHSGNGDQLLRNGKLITGVVFDAKRLRRYFQAPHSGNHRSNHLTVIKEDMADFSHRINQKRCVLPREKYKLKNHGSYYGWIVMRGRFGRGSSSLSRRMDSLKALRFESQPTNNEGSTIALIARLLIKAEWVIRNLEANEVLEVTNKKADCLKSGSYVDDVLSIEFHKQGHAPSMNKGLDAPRYFHAVLAGSCRMHQARSVVASAFPVWAEAVIPAEIRMPTIHTAEVNIATNDDERRIDLDILEERREQAAIRDFVYRANHASHAEDTGKLGPKWEGPYEVTEALGKGAYKLRNMEGRELPRTWNICNSQGNCYL